MTKRKTVRKISKKVVKKEPVKHKKESLPVRELRDDKDIARDFAIQVHKKFDNIIKATILFGSQAEGQAGSSSDIDIVIVVDDAAIRWDLELVAWYREELTKLIAANKYAKDLHVNTIKLTTWWNDLMHGDPVVINVLRYGEAIIDFGGFFNPLKALLLQGKIHSTPEAVYAALQRAPGHLARSEAAQMGSIEGVYWAMVDSAQAALITLGKLPPSPQHIPEMLVEHFVNKKLLKLELIRWYKDIYVLHKRIMHGQILEVKGVEIDEWQERAGKFIKSMTDIIDTLIEASKGN